MPIAPSIESVPPRTRRIAAYPTEGVAPGHKVTPFRGRALLTLARHTLRDGLAPQPVATHSPWHADARQGAQRLANRRVSNWRLQPPTKG